MTGYGSASATVDTKVRSEFFVKEICCASEIPAIRSIVEPMVGVAKVLVNVPIKTVYVDHDVYLSTASTIRDALNKNHFGAKLVKDGQDLIKEKQQSNLGASGNSGGTTGRSELLVKQICCASEIPAVRSIVEPLPGVTKVSINVPNKTVYVDHDTLVTSAQSVQDALNKDGFGASVVKDAAKTSRMVTLADLTTPSIVTSILVFDESREPVKEMEELLKSTYPNTYQDEQKNFQLKSFQIDNLNGKIVLKHNPSTLSAQQVVELLASKLDVKTTIEKDGGVGVSSSSTYNINVVNGVGQQQDIAEDVDVDALPKLAIILAGVFWAISLVSVLGGPWYVFRICMDSHMDIRGTGTWYGMGLVVLCCFVTVVTVMSTMSTMKMQPYHESCIPLPSFRCLTQCPFAVLWPHLPRPPRFPVCSTQHRFYLRYVAILSLCFSLPQFSQKAFSGLKRFQIDANCLTLLAAVGAVFLGDFLDAAAVAFLFSISEWLEARATSRARNALAAIINLRPETAHLVHPSTNEVMVLPAGSVPVGAVVSVKTGDKIPCDGIVIRGVSAVDESSLTGESRPVSKAVGSAVSGGTVNAGLAELRIRTTATSDTSAVSRLIRLVEEAQTQRSPTEQIIDQFSNRYTQIVILVSLTVCTIPWFFGVATGLAWCYIGLCLLVVACPCAVVISTPVTYVAGLAAMAQSGVLIKGGVHLEVSVS